MTVPQERVCARGGCGRLVTGRADKRYCCDVCRNTANRSRSDPIRSANRSVPVSVVAGKPVPVWDPPGEGRRVYVTSEPCQGCGGPLSAGPRGTWRACLACQTAVTPAAVLAPYARGDGAPQRQVASQHERDLAALALVRRKGVMLAQLAQLAADERLAEESRPVVEWFREQAKAASSGHRLDELASLLPEAGIRRRRWWHGEPAALGAPLAWDSDSEDWDQDDGGDLADDAAAGHPRAIVGVPVPDYAAALASHGYRADAEAGDEGRCCIEASTGLSAGPCPGAAVRAFGPYQVCERHYQALTFGSQR